MLSGVNELTSQKLSYKTTVYQIFRNSGDYGDVTDWAIVVRVTARSILKDVNHRCLHCDRKARRWRGKLSRCANKIEISAKPSEKTTRMNEAGPGW